MPRGGSKKGEHRGNAKPRDGLETPQELMHAAVKTVRKPTKPGGTKGPGVQLGTIEQGIRIAQIVHGRRDARDMTPKEVMLDNMAKFQNAAYLTEAMIEFVQKVDPPGEERSRAIRAMEQEAERNRRIASDEAYKVAPYIHPRLAALAVSGSRDTGNNIVRAMLDMIAKQNREAPMVIEHVPTKRTA